MTVGNSIGMVLISLGVLGIMACGKDVSSDGRPPFLISTPVPTVSWTVIPVPTPTVQSPYEYDYNQVSNTVAITPVPTPTSQPVIVINRIEVRVDTSANLTPTPVPTVFCPEDYRCSYQVRTKVRVRHYEQR